MIVGSRDTVVKTVMCRFKQWGEVSGGVPTCLAEREVRVGLRGRRGAQRERRRRGQAVRVRAAAGPRYRLAGRRLHYTPVEAHDTSLRE